MTFNTHFFIILVVRRTKNRDDQKEKQEFTESEVVGIDILQQVGVSTDETATIHMVKGHNKWNHFSQKNKLHIGVDVDESRFLRGLLDVIKEVSSYIRKDTEPLRHWDIERTLMPLRNNYKNILECSFSFDYG